MKRIIFNLIFLFVLATAINAQHEAGKMWITGNVGFSKSTIEQILYPSHEAIEINGKMTTYQFIPEFGMQLSDKIGVGIQLGYSYQKTTFTEVDYKVKSSYATIQPFVRYSFLKGTLGGFFLDGSIGGRYGKAHLSYNNEEETYKGFSVGIQPGVYINISKNISVIGKFSFLGYQYDKTGDTKSNNFGLDLNMDQLQMGVMVAF